MKLGILERNLEQVEICLRELQSSKEKRLKEINELKKELERNSKK